MAEPLETTYNDLDRTITRAYDALGELADALFEAAHPPANQTPREFLDDLDRRLPIDEIRGYVLAARHDLHGALTAIVKARGRLNARRPTFGDLRESTTDPDPQAEERAPAQD